MQIDEVCSDGEAEFDDREIEKKVDREPGYLLQLKRNEDDAFARSMAKIQVVYVAVGGPRLVYGNPDMPPPRFER